MFMIFGRLLFPLVSPSASCLEAREMPTCRLSCQSGWSRSSTGLNKAVTILNAWRLNASSGGSCTRSISSPLAFHHPSITPQPASDNLIKSATDLPDGLHCERNWQKSDSYLREINTESFWEEAPSKAGSGAPSSARPAPRLVCPEPEGLYD